MEENTKNMLAGRPYLTGSGEITTFMHHSHLLCQKYNALPEDDVSQRHQIIDDLLGQHGKNCFLQGPIQFDYGRYTKVGDNFYANFNLTVLDTCPVHIGNNVMLGPNVTLATPLHPLRWQQRNPHQQANGQETTMEYGAPITIGDNCWLASNVTVCAGVTIGNGCVVGAGAVVTHDMPDNSLILGVPARAVRQITSNDTQPYYPYWLNTV